MAQAHKITEEISNNQFTKNLLELMKNQNVTEAFLARETRIPQPTLHKILSGKTLDPRISTLKQLADYFHISLDDLFSTNVASSKIKREEAKTQLVPILDWTTCVNKGSLTQALYALDAKDNLVISNIDDTALFGLYTMPSMEPRFLKGTILVISANTEPSDGDLVIVHYANTDNATVRELSIDGPNKLLLPINANYMPEPFDKKINIIGVVIQSRFNYS